MRIVFDSPITRAYKYLTQNLPETTIERENEPTDYDPNQPLIIIQTAGGNGNHTHQLINARITYDVRAPTIQEAENLAYTVEALAREWQEKEEKVYLRSPGTPVWNPEPDRRIPAYTMTFVYDFKGHIEKDK